MKIHADGDRLVLRGPTESIDPPLRDAIRAKKESILELLARSVPSPERSVSTAAPEGVGDSDLSTAQRRFLELQALEPDSTVYNLPGGFRLTGPLDRGALRAALARLVERQAILRSAFRKSGTDVRLETLPPFEPQWTDVDLSSLPDAERERALRAYLEEASDEPIDLENGPPFHLHLVRIGPDEHALLITAHSAVWDGWSFDVFLEELGAHYEGVRSGTPSKLEPLAADYIGYARDQAARRAAGRFDRSIAYWTEELAGSPPSLSLNPRPVVAGPESFDGARVPYRIEADRLEEIRSLARSHGATTNMVLVAALDVLLYRSTGETDIMISTPFQGRSEPIYENLIGVFVNTLFLRARVDPAASFSALLEQTRRKALEAVEHQDAPSDVVVERLGASGLERPPHELMFVFQQAASRNTRMADIEVRSIMRGVRKVSLELIVWAREYEDYVDGAFDYRLTALDEDRVARLRDRYLRVVEQVVTHPDVPLEELALDLEEDAAVRDHRALPTSAPVPADVVHRTGVVSGTDPVPQSSLDEVAATATDTPDVPLRITMDGSWQSVTLLQAAAAANGPCVVAEGDLETSDPPTRTSDLPTGTSDPPTGTSDPPTGTSDLPTGNREPGVTFLAPGSDGRIVELHRSWSTLRTDAAVLADEIGLTEGRGIALFGDIPPSAFVTAVVAAGMTGARVFLPEPGLPADGLELDDWVEQESLATIVAGSVSMGELVQTGWESTVDIVVGTDPFTGSKLVADVRPLTRRMLKGWCPPGAVAWATLGDWDDDVRAPGPAAPGVAFLLLDSAGRPAALDAPGTLVLVDHRGPEPRRHELGIRARWTADQLRCIVGGDRHAWEVNGSLVVGSRVEELLGSVEEVADVHVFLEESPEDGRRVCACLTTAPGVDAFQARVAATSAARDRLPRSWIPTRFHVLDRIPRDQDGSGAVDRRSLRLALRQFDRGGADAPTTDSERAIARVWEESLGLTGVTVDDNFFDIGGHSLLAVQIVARLSNDFGIDLQPRSLFFHSLAQLARSATSEGASA